MFEKVNPEHPDKVADRIAGAFVDIITKYKPDANVAVEVLIGHGRCYAIIETDACPKRESLEDAVFRIAPAVKDCVILIGKQDPHLAENQKEKIRCGDNGIFKGVPVTDEQKELTDLVQKIYGLNHSDGKYIIAPAVDNNGKERKAVTCCQSNMTIDSLEWILKDTPYILTINPLGPWTGGIDVDCGATNRKLGSDMGDSVTGGGLHGKDLSKADVSVNIYAFLKAQETGQPVELHCSIGDEFVDGKPYSEIVDIAGEYIKALGGFEKFAEWGLIR